MYSCDDNSKAFCFLHVALVLKIYFIFYNMITSMKIFKNKYPACGSTMKEAFKVCQKAGINVLFGLTLADAKE